MRKHVGFTIKNSDKLILGDYRQIKILNDGGVIKILYQIAFGYEDKNWIDEKKAFLSVSAVKKSISIIKK